MSSGDRVTGNEDKERMKIRPKTEIRHPGCNSPTAGC
jgi:hypothetical protein